MSIKQVILLVSVAVLMGFLLSLDIKKAGIPSSGQNKPSRMPVSEASIASPVIHLDSLEERDLNSLPQKNSKSIRDLENELKKDSSFKNLMAVSMEWSKSSPLFWGAHYKFKAAIIQPDMNHWLEAGNSLNESLSSTQDSLSQRVIFNEASHSFQEALKIDGKNLEAKAGLGVAYVAGSDNPMQGISLLLEVVRQDPKNLKANFSLGLFSIKSGQFEKAINRFQTVIQKQPSGEAYFYLGFAYQKLNRKKEAIESYLESKKYIKDPLELNSIDQSIKELTN